MRYVAFDFETYLFEPGVPAPPPVCASFCASGGPPVFMRANAALDYLRTLVRDPNVTLIAHNAPYDFGVLANAAPDTLPHIFQAYRSGRVADTKVRQMLMDIASGRRQKNAQTTVYQEGSWVPVKYGLADTEIRYGLPDRRGTKNKPDAWRERYAELAYVPTEEWPKEAIDYVLADSSNTLFIYERQRELYPDGVPNEYEQVFADWCMHLMKCWGSCTDPRAVEEFTEVVEREFALVQQRMLDEGLYKIGGTKREPKITKNMEAIYARVKKAYEDQGLAVPYTEKMRVKTDVDTLSESDDELLEELGGGSGWGKLRSTYLPVLRQGTTRRINPSHNILVNSGRVSMFEPNLQNLPRGDGGGSPVRECFTAPDGKLFSAVDLAAAESRALGQVQLAILGRSKWAEFFQKYPKGDPHLSLAGTIVGYSDEEALAHRKDQKVKDARQYAKVPNFALPGGMGFKKFKLTAKKQLKGTELSDDFIRKLMRVWNQRWDMQPWFDYMFRLVGFGGCTTIEQYRPDGKPHRKRGMVGYADGLNTFFQGLVADGVKEALIMLTWECFMEPASPLYGCHPVFMIHDEIILEVPDDPVKANAAALRHCELMIAGMQKWCPDVPIYAEPTLMKRWYKGAEAVYKDGLLIPWEPSAKVSIATPA